MKATVLSTRPRIKFDISNKQHLKLAKNFFETGKWGSTGCPFKPEFPYQSVPDFIKTQIVLKYLGISQTVDLKNRIF